MLAAGAAVGTATLVHYLPSVAVLGTFAPHPPRAVGHGVCRWRLPQEAAAVALTFDDGPCPQTTPRTLDLLHELGIRATFFVIGERAAAHPELCAEMARRGHAVGVHGFRHDHHLRRGPRWVRHDTEAAVAAVSSATGATPRWYRPPYGQLTACTVVEARRHDLQVVLWSCWGREFAETRPEPVLARLQGGLVPGAVLLLHDSDAHARSGTASLTHQVLSPLAESLHRRGLPAVTLDDALDGAGRLAA